MVMINRRLKVGAAFGGVVYSKRHVGATSRVRVEYTKNILHTINTTPQSQGKGGDEGDKGDEGQATSALGLISCQSLPR